MGNGTFRPRLGLFNLRQLEQDMVLVQCARDVKNTGEGLHGLVSIPFAKKA